MKSIKRYISLFGWIFMLACNAVLDTEDQSAIDQEGLFEDKGLAELYLNYLYQPVIPGFSMLSNSGATDDGTDGGDAMNGQLVDPAAGTDDTPGKYTVATYGYIRNINVFLDGVANSPLAVEDQEELMGQAYFLRAFLYWDLVLDYGGVPIVEHILDINEGEEAYTLPRSSAQECVDFIVSDLNLSIDLLSGKTMEYGRITPAAAAAMKGRVLLFFASPQFDPNRDGAGIASSADGIAARWATAYKANLDAKIIADAAGHGLFPNYGEVFLTEDNEEAILITKYSTGLGTHTYENAVRPNSVANNVTLSVTPNWDFVKAFPMSDGRSITEDPGYDSLQYWVDRDPRFYDVIAYNGCEWAFEGREGTRQWTYQGNDQESGVLPNTGFYLRKNINTSLERTQSVQTPTDWIEIRYAEVLLNLAEAANEVGNTTEALDLLYQIRQRAGILAGSGNYGITSTSKTDLRAVIFNERRIELCFENKRHFDLKRRNLFVRDLDGAGTGLQGTRRTGIQTELDLDYIRSLEPSLTTDAETIAFFEENIRDTVNWDATGKLDDYFNYTLEYMDNEVSPINFLQPKYSFYYLPTNATVRNDKLQQTMGWLDGTFDPLIN